MIISLIVFYQLAGVIVFKSEVYRVIYLIVVKFKMIPLGDFVLIGAKAGIRVKKNPNFWCKETTTHVLGAEF